MKPTLFLSAASAILAVTFVFPVIVQGAKPLPVLTVKTQKVKVEPAVCIAKAATDRDAAISKALVIVVTALQTRSKALASANVLSDAKKKKAAIKAAEAAFKGTWEKLNTARKTAWTLFNTAAGVCRVG